MELELLILLRLVVALILGGVLGWERQTVGKAAGLRTHMLVAVGAALFVGLSLTLVEGFTGYGDQQRFDPTRVLEAVVAGVSFLGAGSIIFTRNMDRVRGLTTAASLWTTAGVGMAAGLGRYVLAAGATALILIVLRALLRLEDKARAYGGPDNRPSGLSRGSDTDT